MTIPALFRYTSFCPENPEHCMNTKSGKKEKTDSSNETRITALTLLKNFYDEQIFSILSKYFFNSNLDVSLAAVPRPRCAQCRKVAGGSADTVSAHGDPKKIHSPRLVECPLQQAGNVAKDFVVDVINRPGEIPETL